LFSNRSLNLGASNEAAAPSSELEFAQKGFSLARSRVLLVSKHMPFSSC